MADDETPVDEGSAAGDMSGKDGGGDATITEGNMDGAPGAQDGGNEGSIAEAAGEDQGTGIGGDVNSGDAQSAGDLKAEHESDPQVQPSQGRADDRDDEAGE